MGVIPSGQENHSGAEHLNFPGGELNVIFSFFTEQYFLKKKLTGHCFFLTDIHIYIYIYIYIYIQRQTDRQTDIKSEITKARHMQALLSIYIYIYIYILSFTDRLFLCITTLQCVLICRALEAAIETHPTLRYIYIYIYIHLFLGEV